MTTKEKNNLFLENEKLLHHKCQYYFMKYNRQVPYHDIESFGLELFVRCLKKYDSTKGTKFSTYLWYQLDALNQFAKTRYIKNLNVEYVETSILNVLQAPDPFANMYLNDSLSQLSELSQEVVKRLLDGSLVGYGNKKQQFSMKILKEEFGLIHVTAQKVWYEIETWFNKLEEVYV